MASITETRKSRKPSNRTATLGALSDGAQLLWLTQDGKTRGYRLTPLPSDFGAAYRLHKADAGDGHSEQYDVCLDLEHGRHSCECLGFLKHHHCKHLESIIALVQAGKLVAPKPAPQPQVNDLHAMKCGEVRQVNGHRVERVASAWLIDGKAAMTPRQLAELLS